MVTYIRSEKWTLKYVDSLSSVMFHARVIQSEKLHARCVFTKIKPSHAHGTFETILRKCVRARVCSKVFPTWSRIFLLTFTNNDSKATSVNSSFRVTVSSTEKQHVSSTNCSPRARTGHSKELKIPARSRVEEVDEHGRMRKRTWIKRSI